MRFHQLPKRCLTLALASAVLSSASLASSGSETSVSELRERVRAATGHAALRALERGVRITGSCERHGVEGQYSLLFEPGGAFLQEVRTTLPDAHGFDGTDCWTRDATELTRIISLDARDRVLGRVWTMTGRWLDEDSPFDVSIDAAGSDAATVAVELRLGTYSSTLLVDREDWLPERLVIHHPIGDRTLRFGDWRRPLGFAVAHEVDVTGLAGDRSIYRVQAVQPAPTFMRNPYEPVPGRPADTRFDPTATSALEVERTHTGHLLVKARLQGRDAGWFLLDSGAGSVCIDPDLARELDLERVGEVPVAGAGGVLLGTCWRGADLALGPMEVTGLAWLELDLGPLEPTLGHEIAGVIGYDVFARAVIEIDLLAPGVELHDPGRFELTSGTWQPMLLDGHLPCVEGSFEGGHRGWFRVDTGADDSVLFHGPTVARLHLLEGRRTSAVSIAGVAGARPSRRGELAWFELAGRRFEDLSVTFFQGGDGVFQIEGTLGIVGNALLQRFRSVWDYPHRRVAFVPRAE